MLTPAYLTTLKIVLRNVSTQKKHDSIYNAIGEE